LWGVNFPEDVVKWEANHARNEKLWAQKERRQAWSDACQAVKERGEDTLPNLNPNPRRKRREK
jgi:hypothetical protein